jgi:2OG-Fe(II) oxygenase superfamily
VTTTTLEKIAELLREVGAPSAFTARRTAATDDLHLEVKGVGRLRFPLSGAQAQRLSRLARPARYGRGQQTLLDRRVRDTGEIPRSWVKIDRRRWNRTLLPVLDALRGDLGLPEGCRLAAELHSMLVYAPGQFFLPHQDSEKADEMVGTLVVTLPAPFKGGAFVVEHRGEKVTHRTSKERLSFVAFYADCHHEVRPVTEGYRIVLTYNLLLAGAEATAAAEVSPATVDALARCLGEHFETPLPPQWSWPKDAPPRHPPSRLVYLLDHQYTERGFGWHRLKGNDAARVQVLQAAAERAGCETVLALAEVQETWDCMEPGWDERFYGGRHRHWERDEDDEWTDDDEPPALDDPDAYELGDLIEQGITLDRWINPSGKTAEPVVTHVGGEEVCSTKPSSDLEPYASEYEGYMGNWGNTMDRWYRRGAIVVWPRERSFAVRAEASPGWALETLKRRLQIGEVAEARAMAASLVSFWENVVTRGERCDLFAKALRVAEGLDRPALAASLLQPFQVEELTPAAAPAFAALVARYDEGWVRALLSTWSDPDRRWVRTGGPDRLAWLVSLPDLCQALRAADDAVGTPAAPLLIQDSWAWLKREIDETRDLERPSERDEALAALAGPILGVLGSAAVVGAIDLRDQVITALSAAENEPLVPSLVRILRAAAGKSAPPEIRAALGLEAIERLCTRRLEARLAQPARRTGDWSVVLPMGCSCKLCGTLRAFLGDSDKKQLEWPLAKDGRKHVHRRLDDHEIPVRHETRRSGSPFTLVLTKTEALFKREATERRSQQADLAWLAGRRRRSVP